MRALIVTALAAVLAASSAAAAPTAVQAPTEISATGPGGELKATWRGPAAEEGVHPPIMLFVPGSGPTDRDGNNPLGVAGRPYGKLMEALALEGISTVAVDKRGQFGSDGARFGPEGPTIAGYAADMKAWIAQVREETGAPCVWLSGHSEGVLVALVTAQDAQGVCGLVLISGPGRRLSDVIREQIRANPANPPEILTQSDAALTALEAGQKVDVSTYHPALQQLFAPVNQAFLISMFSYDPAALLKTYSGPVLVLQGATDIQVSVADAQRLAGARAGVTLQLVDGMNHVLRAAPAERAANAATYADASAPVFPGLAASIANFIKSHR